MNWFTRSSKGRMSFKRTDVRISGICEYPRSVAWMRLLGQTLADTIDQKRPSKPPTVNPLAVLFRNLLFLFIVLLHGFRGLAPRYFNVDAMGSQHHARQSRQRGDNTVGMLCLEMVGYYSLHKGSQEIPPAIPKILHRFFPKRGNFFGAFRRGFQGTRTARPLTLPAWSFS